MLMSVALAGALSGRIEMKPARAAISATVLSFIVGAGTVLSVIGTHTSTLSATRITVNAEMQNLAS
jgi:hypothetical protein